MNTSQHWFRISCATLLLAVLILSACRSERRDTATKILSAHDYLDGARGYWLGALIGNYTGLPYEGQFIDRPSNAESIEWALLPEYSTDDDTLVEWVYLHILESHGLWPSYIQIRDNWVDHLNNDIWCANRTARDLMDEGLLPPLTGQAEHNPHSGWNIDAQIQSEIFGVIAPGMPAQARERAGYFSRVTNHGTPVDTAEFYAVLYSLAFFEDDPKALIESARTHFQSDNSAVKIADDVLKWHAATPDNWRRTRELIDDKYDTDPGWNAARVNFASTLMALLYGEGDFEQTVTIVVLAGWDSDCNATTAAGLIGTTVGYSHLPAHLRDAAGHVYLNEDVTGGLPKRETLDETAARLQALTEQTILANGGWIQEYGKKRIYHLTK